MILSNSPFLDFQKTNRIFKEFYLSHAKTTVSLPIVVSIVGKTKMSRTFLSIEFKSFKREIKVVESCFLLEAIILSEIDFPVFTTHKRDRSNVSLTLRIRGFRRSKNPGGEVISKRR